jgi:hypothetical protein
MLFQIGEFASCSIGSRGPFMTLSVSHGSGYSLSGSENPS